MKSRLLIFLTVMLVIVVLAALNAASYVRVEQEADAEFAPDRSTQNGGATGTRALYEFLRQSGHQVVRWGQSPSALSDKGAARPSTFVMVGRLRRQVEKEDADALLRWVAQGGRLVIIDRRPDTKLLPAAGTWHVASEIFDYPRSGARPDNTESMTEGVPPLAPAQPTLLTRDVTQVTRSRFAGRLHIYPTADDAKVDDQSPPPPVSPGGGDGPPTVKATPATQNENRNEGSPDEAGPTPPKPARGVGGGGPVVTVGTETQESADPPAPVRHLADGRDGEGSLLVDYVYGRGRIVILSDPYIVSNGGINLADNLILATNVVAGAGGLIAFDEYHQGYGAAEHGMLAYFAGTPIIWMLAQAAIIILAVVWTSGRRFARPLPAPHVDRRSKLEFVASMAELQGRARAYDLAVENIYGRTRRALARYGGIAASAPYTEIAARVAARSGRNSHELEALLRDCEDATAGAHTNARTALALVRRLRELERDLGIRMRSREIRQAERG